ncbi:MAG TPA: hypothetical protein VJS91_04700 [Nitrososphaeraceae archaeon]|nr:hypothetical protein [Nitrososphaeraceae archaeon]
MGITLEKTDVKDNAQIEEISEDIQNGTYGLVDYDLLWSINFVANTITLNLVYRYGPTITTRVITREEYRTEFHTAQLDAQISANFDAKQLLLNGSYRSRNMHSHGHLITRKKYENVIITSW